MFLMFTGFTSFSNFINLRKSTNANKFIYHCVGYILFCFWHFDQREGDIYISMGVLIINFQHCLLFKSDNNLKISHSFAFNTLVKYLIIDR